MPVTRRKKRSRQPTESRPNYRVRDLLGAPRAKVQLGLLRRGRAEKVVNHIGHRREAVYTAQFNINTFSAQAIAH